jgi:hypothetical protein
LADCENLENRCLGVGAIKKIRLQISWSVFHPGLMFEGKGEEPTLRMEPLRGAPLRSAPTLLANIRLGWEGFPGTDPPAYL